ncbi:DEKNAAC100178 [Brettanomyces naardenensis]|uniref:RNA helicase n=1 Tax=Brettanomyces naardenensis TaxID=13370 RepID=A0A448YFI4_BRENA|nr:DEKNAAC100178 [Brettanomyces naardenensis]
MRSMYVLRLGSLCLSRTVCLAFPRNCARALPRFSPLISQRFSSTETENASKIDEDALLAKSSSFISSETVGDVEGLRPSDLAGKENLESAEVRAEEQETEPKAAKPSNFAPTENVSDSLMSPKLKEAFIKNVGSTLTPVQQQSMNDFIQSEAGIVVRAKTGTGKTYAFGIPVMQDMIDAVTSKKGLRKNDYVNTVIFAPTRDLATQTADSLSHLWKGVSSKTVRNDIVLIMGQMSKSANMSSFRRHGKVPRIVVATPGRFLDLFESEPSFRNSLKQLKNIIIDEADELLNTNFKEAMTDIIKDLQDIREPIPDLENDIGRPKTMLFSATMDEDVFDLAKSAIGEHFPFIDVTEHGSEVNENIKQKLLVTDSIFQSYEAATRFVSEHSRDPAFKAIIFVSTTAGVDLAYRTIKDVSERGTSVYQLHGKLTQGRRNSQQKGFRLSKRGVLVASNVAARGMDFPNVTNVIQIGLSPEVSSHTHRIGRTGRAGKKGEATLIVTNTELPYVSALKKQGNRFAEDEHFESEPEFEAKMKSFTKEYDDLEQMIHSYLSSYASIPQEVARLRKDRIAKDCSVFYQDLMDDNTTKPFMSYRSASKIGLDTRVLMKFFNVPRSAGYGGRRRNDEDEDEDEGSSRGYRNDRFGANRRGGEYGDRRSNFGYTNKRNNYSNKRNRRDFNSRDESKVSYNANNRRKPDFNGYSNERSNRAPRRDGWMSRTSDFIPE